MQALRGERFERWLKRPMPGVAALVLPALVLENADVSPTLQTTAPALNWAIWLASAGELLVVRDGAATCCTTLAITDDELAGAQCQPHVLELFGITRSVYRAVRRAGGRAGAGTPDVAA